MGELGEGDQRYKVLVIRKMTSGAIMYNMMTTINNTVLYI